MAKKKIIIQQQRELDIHFQHKVKKLIPASRPKDIRICNPCGSTYPANSTCSICQ